MQSLRQAGHSVDPPQASVSGRSLNRRVEVKCV